MVVILSRLASRSQGYKGSERFRAQRPSCLYGSLFLPFFIVFFIIGDAQHESTRQRSICSSPECLEYSCRFLVSLPCVASLDGMRQNAPPSNRIHTDALLLFCSSCAPYAVVRLSEYQTPRLLGPSPCTPLLVTPCQILQRIVVVSLASCMAPLMAPTDKT